MKTTNNKQTNQASVLAQIEPSEKRGGVGENQQVYYLLHLLQS